MANKDKNPIARAMIWVAVLGLIGTIITTLLTKPEWFGLGEDDPNETEQEHSTNKKEEKFG